MIAVRNFVSVQNEDIEVKSVGKISYFGNEFSSNGNFDPGSADRYKLFICANSRRGGEKCGVRIRYLSEWDVYLVKEYVEHACKNHRSHLRLNRNQRRPQRAERVGNTDNVVQVNRNAGIPVNPQIPIFQMIEQLRRQILEQGMTQRAILETIRNQSTRMEYLENQLRNINQRINDIEYSQSQSIVPVRYDELNLRRDDVELMFNLNQPQFSANTMDQDEENEDSDEEASDGEVNFGFPEFIDNLSQIEDGENDDEDVEDFDLSFLGSDF